MSYSGYKHKLNIDKGNGIHSLSCSLLVQGAGGKVAKTGIALYAWILM